MTEFPFGLQSKDQVRGEEVRSLVFGHELRGRGIDPDGAYVRTTTAEGKARVVVESSFSATGISRMEGDYVCSRWDSVGTEVTCAAIFHNAGGTAENQDEYVWTTPTQHLRFSVVK